jgi:Tol biopolymer transport system component
MTDQHNARPAATPSAASPAWLMPSPFDRNVVLVMLGVLLALGGVVLFGDRVGVRVMAVSPLGQAASGTRVSIQFSEDMQRETVVIRVVQGDVTAAPLVAVDDTSITGTLSWNGPRMAIFTPSQALLSGQQYTAIVANGARSEGGRGLLAEHRFVFGVRLPRVAYLAPANGRVANIFIADPANPAAPPLAVTDSPSGIYDFSVSPDGTRIAFAERSPVSNISEIKIVDLASGALLQVSNCTQEDADCTTPVWRPDGQMLAYERTQLNSDLANVAASPTRVWLIDLTSAPPVHQPLFQDSQILSYGARWSGDGQSIAVFNSAIGLNDASGIIVYNLADQSGKTFLNSYGVTGDLSPNGQQVVYSEVVLSNQQPLAYLKLGDMDSGEVENLTTPEDQARDSQAVWRPDGGAILFLRQYTVGAQTTPGAQIYLLDMTTRAVQPLVVDSAYQHGGISWDSSGQRIVFQRFLMRDVTAVTPTTPALPTAPQLDAPAVDPLTRLPQIWVYDLNQAAPQLLADNAYLGQWVP